MDFSYTPWGVCSHRINFELTDDGKVRNIRFTGGCDGNLKAISKILDGQDADYIISTLLGNDCLSKGTSCADQLARAVRAAKEKAAGQLAAG